MNDAYAGLTRVYDQIFPITPLTLEYLFRCGLKPGGSLLDIGCASGAHPLAFSAAGLNVTGIDPSAAMIDAARARADSLPPERAPRFAQGGMMEISRFAPPGTLDAVTCLGNTLPHLSGFGEMGSFFLECGGALRTGGFLVLQYLNYRKILSERPASLPVIQTEDFTFHRGYEYGDGFLIFRTLLSDLRGREISRGEVRLYPVLPEAVLDMALSRGFVMEALESGWRGESFDPDNSAQAIQRLRKV